MASTTQPDAKVVALAPTAERYDGLTMVTSPAEAHRRLQELQAFVKATFVEGLDFGQVPGTDKPSLFQPGAQKLAELYGFAHDFVDVATVEDWDKPFFFYRRRSVLTTRRDGRFIGAGVGSCNSRESRYAGRWVYDREVPDYIELAKLKRREFTSRQGKPYFKYLVPNEDIFSLVNTIEKMACKRAYIHAVISVTRSSGLFTQDAEDLPAGVYGSVDDVRPWERGRDDDEPADLDVMAKGFEHAVGQLVLRKGTVAELKAIGLAIEESPLDEPRKTKLRTVFRQALAQLGGGRANRKTQSVADQVANRNASQKNAPPPPRSEPEPPPPHDEDGVVHFHDEEE